VKKGFVILLLALAVVILISPGLIGKLAEQSMDENLEFAATESDVVTIESRGYDRSWFSSEGQHRVELREGELYDSLYVLVQDNYDALPALIIDTRIDHGLVPVTSMSREQGSLAPGLGSAVSTLHLEFPDGSLVDLPGTIFSEMGLSGELTSNFVLEPGSFSDGTDSIHWGNVDVVVSMSPSSNVIAFGGTIDEFVLADIVSELALGKLAFEGETEPSGFGFWLGETKAEIESVSAPSALGTSTAGPFVFSERTWLEGDTVSAHGAAQLNDIPFAELGRANILMEIAVEGVHAQSIGNISRAMDDIGAYSSGDALMVALEDDLQQLLATGFKLHIEQLDVELQGGTVSAALNVDVAATDIDDFVWTSILMAADATFDASIPAELYDYFVSVDPSVSAAAGMGFLRRNGEVYEMRATLKNGLLEINGAPMPGLIPGLQ
jgi:uncharacterized protein YdgA (DUF945 family)